MNFKDFDNFDFNKDFKKVRNITIKSFIFFLFLKLMIVIGIVFGIFFFVKKCNENDFIKKAGSTFENVKKDFNEGRKSVK